MGSSGFRLIESEEALSWVVARREQLLAETRVLDMGCPFNKQRAKRKFELIQRYELLLRESFDAANSHMTRTLRLVKS